MKYRYKSTFLYHHVLTFALGKSFVIKEFQPRNVTYSNTSKCRNVIMKVTIELPKGISQNFTSFPLFTRVR